MNDEPKSSFIRWQRYTIEQLSFINNLIIGLSVGILAIQFNIIFGEFVKKSDCASNWLLVVSIGLLFISLIVGCVTAWNRLKDFRITAKIARKKEKQDSTGLNDLRNQTQQIGRRTWCLFNCQLVLFILGILPILPIVILRVINE